MLQKQQSKTNQKIDKILRKKSVNLKNIAITEHV